MSRDVSGRQSALGVVAEAADPYARLGARAAGEVGQPAVGLQALEQPCRVRRRCVGARRMQVHAVGGDRRRR